MFLDTVTRDRSREKRLRSSLISSFLSQKTVTSCFLDKHSAIVIMYFSPPPKSSRYGSKIPILTLLLYQLLHFLHKYDMLYLYMNFPSGIPQLSPILIYLVFLWSIVWKGFALWRGAKYNQRNWFIAILVLNTAGILEIVYLFYFCKNRFTISSIKSSIMSLMSKR